MVSMRSSTTTLTSPRNPFMPSSSVATWRLSSLTPCVSFAPRECSAVMLNAPGLPVAPPQVRTAVPNVKGPIAFGCTITCSPICSGMTRESK